jgi:hypothetical protein
VETAFLIDEETAYYYNKAVLVLALRKNIIKMENII